MEDKAFKFDAKSLAELKLPARGCLGILEEQAQVPPAIEEKRMMEAQAQSRAEVGAPEGPVMFSYNQEDSQPLVLELKGSLQAAGLSTWVDVENMPPCDLYQGMADAVVQAGIVLVCVSRKYKGSAMCQYEAEYAAKKRKRMLFLHVEVRNCPF